MAGQVKAISTPTQKKAVEYSPRDVKPNWGTPEWKAYEAADKAAKAAKASGDYQTQADKTPFSWVAAWAYFNLARTTYKEDAEKAMDYLSKSDALRQQAITSGVYPKEGPNNMDRLSDLIGQYQDLIGKD